MRTLLLALAAVSVGCAGARTSIRADHAEFPISLSERVRAADGHVLGLGQATPDLRKVGNFCSESTIFGTLYEAIPFNPTTDISDDVNRQVRAAGGQAVTGLTVSNKPCASDYFAVFHLLPFWLGCSTVTVAGSIVRDGASPPDPNEGHGEAQGCSVPTAGGIGASLPTSHVDPSKVRKTLDVTHLDEVVNGQPESQILAWFGEPTSKAASLLPKMAPCTHAWIYVASHMENGKLALQTLSVSFDADGKVCRKAYTQSP